MPATIQIAAVGLGQHRLRGVKKGQYMVTPIKPLSLSERGQAGALARALPVFARPLGGP